MYETTQFFKLIESKSMVKQLVASEGSFEDAEMLVVTSWEQEKSWVQERNTLRLRSWKKMELFTLETTKLERLDSFRLMMFDKREFLLQDVRYVPELK
jgi:hypothetical protein